jgi:hypothetical protein
MINIVNAKYVTDALTNENCAINCVMNGEHLSVPLNPDNSDYAEIMRQVEAGDLTIEDAD